MLEGACRAPPGQLAGPPGTWNNHLGVPFTLLLLESKHQAAVLELGINDFGEMKALAEVAEVLETPDPDVRRVDIRVQAKGRDSDAAALSSFLTHAGRT